MPRSPQVNPAVINSQPTTQRTLVWMGTVTSTSAVSVSRACLLSQLVLISSGSGVTSTTFPCLMTSVRVKSVRVWTPAIPNNVNTPNTGVSFQWLSDLGAEEKRTRVTLGSVASSFRTSPPPMSRAGMWSRAASLAATLEEVLFTLDIEEGAGGSTQTIYISMDLEYKIADASPGRLNVTFSGAENLNYGMYQMWLDLLTPSNTMGTLTLQPVGLQTPVLASVITALTRTS